MSTAAIRIKGLGKRYLVNHERQRGDYQTLRESLVHLASWPLRRLKGERRSTREEFWALKDVSFEVQPGEVVGIIGRNGAGKSTLLKTLSRITKPTTGRIELNGRVGSLLEVGTGFHPELTGRENIYLNGSILGMTKREIDRKFDAIIDFAGIEKFLDTPVKRYSSGMYVRLAFAVAAHLDPEMLIIDEVLAVGDAEFQRKCLGKMEEVASRGRTVLFVSHNMSAVQNLCSRGVVLREGRVDFDGTIDRAVDRYLAAVEESSQCNARDRRDRRGTGKARFVAVTISANSKTPRGQLVTGYPARFEFHTAPVLPGLECCFTVYDHQGNAVTNFDTRLRSPNDLAPGVTDNGFVCELPVLALRPGRYRINAALYEHATLVDHLEGAAVFEVGDGSYMGRMPPRDRRIGSVWLEHCWKPLA